MSKILRSIVSISIAAGIGLAGVAIAGPANAAPASTGISQMPLHPGGGGGDWHHGGSRNDGRGHYFDQGRSFNQWNNWNYNAVPDWYNRPYPGYVQFGNLWCPPPPPGMIVLVIGGIPWFAPVGAQIPPFAY